MERHSQPFETFCTALLDKVASVKGVNRKKDALSDFLHEWRRRYGLDFYDPLRLIMPDVNISFSFEPLRTLTLFVYNSSIVVECTA